MTYLAIDARQELVIAVVVFVTSLLGNQCNTSLDDV